MPIATLAKSLVRDRLPTVLRRSSGLRRSRPGSGSRCSRGRRRRRGAEVDLVQLGTGAPPLTRSGLAKKPRPTTTASASSLSRSSSTVCSEVAAEAAVEEHRGRRIAAQFADKRFDRLERVGEDAQVRQTQRSDPVDDRPVGGGQNLPGNLTEAVRRWPGESRRPTGRTDGIGHRRHDLDDETGPPLRRTAELVVAQVDRGSRNWCSR